MPLTPKLSATSDAPGYEEKREKVRPTSRRERIRGAVSAPAPKPTRESMRMPQNETWLEDKIRKILMQSMPKTGFFGGPSSAGAGGLPGGAAIGQVIVNNGSSNEWSQAFGWPLDGMGVSTTNGASGNLAIITAAMNRGGTMTLYTPGTYYINPLPAFPDGTELYLGPGVQLVEVPT